MKMLLTVLAIFTACNFTAARAEDHTDTTVESAHFVAFLNEASTEELISADGIGKTLAARIIAARPFEKPADIFEVKGIGEKKARALQTFALTVWER